VNAKGRLILLNGGSSAGKSSLGMALQGLLDEPYLLLGIDVFWMALPPRQLDLDAVEPAYYSWHMEIYDHRKHFVVVPGPILDRAMYARYRATAAYLESGLNVVADEVVWKPEWLADALKVFEPYEVYFVGVHVSDAEGARRERERGNRHAGWNRGSARYAHQNARGVYDYEIDTTHESPAACAARVKAALSGVTPVAFPKLRSLLQDEGRHAIRHPR
jgi:chloramphenicol 3-O phosphotransferase